MKLFGHIRLLLFLLVIIIGFLCACILLFYKVSEHNWANSTNWISGPVKNFTASTSGPWLANKSSRVNASSSPQKIDDVDVDVRRLKPPGVVSYVNNGMGNQLFRVASSYGLARQLNVPLFIVILGERKDFKTTSNILRNPGARAYALDIFNLTSSEIEVIVISSKTWDPVRTKAIKEKRILTYACFDYFFERINKTEAATKFIDYPTETGFCHSEKYFEDYAPEVLGLLAFKQSFLNSTSQQFLKWRDKITHARGKNSTSAAIHIRRGDYLGKRHWPTPKSFFEEAIGRMVEEHCDRKVTFFLFSDDIEYVKVKEKLKTVYQPTKAGRKKKCRKVPNFIYVSEKRRAKRHNGLTSLEEFILMTLCENIIISNSSFSWWAAYLNTNPNKTVIGPTFHKDFYDGWKIPNVKMFRSLISISYKYPKNWITLDPYNGTGL